METLETLQFQVVNQEDLPRHLFGAVKTKAYAVLDGASNPALLDHLYCDGIRPEFECLYRGELEPDMAECAPYLVCLEQGSAFTEWLLANCYGNHWGIFALSPAGFREVFRHFRKHNMVFDENGNSPLYFRYYDPRVLRQVIMLFSKEQLTDFFGQVTAFFTEGVDVNKHFRFDLAGQ